MAGRSEACFVENKFRRWLWGPGAAQPAAVAQGIEAGAGGAVEIGSMGGTDAVRALLFVFTRNYM